MHPIILRTDEALNALAPEWSELAPPTPFTSWEFVRTWLDQRPRGTEPFVVAVRSNEGTLLAIAPWCIERKKGGLRRLTGIGSHDAWGHDPIGLGSGSEAVALLAETLWQHRSAWDWISLNLRQEASLPLLEGLAAKGWLVEDHGDRHQHHVIDFGAGFEAYWAARSSSHRKKVRSLVKHLDRVPHRYLQADAETLDELLGALFALHAERWQGIRPWAPYYEQVRAMSRRAVARGELCLGALEIDGHLAALDLALRCGDRGYGLMRVYDPAYAEYSPGALLGVWMLERLESMGCRLLDCGPGHYEWKDRYSTGQLAGMRALATSRANPAGLAVLGWLGLVQPWRQRTAPEPVLKERLLALTGLIRRPSPHPLKLSHPHHL